MNKFLGIMILFLFSLVLGHVYTFIQFSILSNGLLILFSKITLICTSVIILPIVDIVIRKFRIVGKTTHYIVTFSTAFLVLYFAWSSYICTFTKQYTLYSPLTISSFVFSQNNSASYQTVGDRNDVTEYSLNFIWSVEALMMLIVPMVLCIDSKMNYCPNCQHWLTGKYYFPDLQLVSTTNSPPNNVSSYLQDLDYGEDFNLDEYLMTAEFCTGCKEGVIVGITHNKYSEEKADIGIRELASSTLVVSPETFIDKTVFDLADDFIVDDESLPYIESNSIKIYSLLGGGCILAFYI